MILKTSEFKRGYESRVYVLRKKIRVLKFSREEDLRRQLYVRLLQKGNRKYATEHGLTVNSEIFIHRTKRFYLTLMRVSVSVSSKKKKKKSEFIKRVTGYLSPPNQLGLTDPNLGSKL